jgi:hypothetical protein
MPLLDDVPSSASAGATRTHIHRCARSGNSVLIDHIVRDVAVVDIFTAVPTTAVSSGNTKAALSVTSRRGERQLVHQGLHFDLPGLGAHFIGDRERPDGALRRARRPGIVRLYSRDGANSRGNPIVGGPGISRIHRESCGQSIRSDEGLGAEGLGANCNDQTFRIPDVADNLTKADLAKANLTRAMA